MLESSFALDSARQCILALKLTNFGSRESLSFRCDTEGAEVVATEVLPQKNSRHSLDSEIRALVAIRWRARPSMLRLVCRADTMNAAIGISNFDMTSLVQFAASADPYWLIALANVLRPTTPELVPANSHVLERVRKLGRREFFLNWLPAAEDRYVCLVLPVGLHDASGPRLVSLLIAGAKSLLPVSCSAADNYVVLVYDIKDLVGALPSLELAAVIQEKLHYWKLESRSVTGHASANEPEQLLGLASRWTGRVGESIAVARSDLLGGTRWEMLETGAAIVKFQPEIDNPVLVVTDVLDMFSLTLTMAAAQNWKTRFERMFLLLPPWSGADGRPEADPLCLIENFGGNGVLEPITTDDLNWILQSLQVGSSIAFASAAAPYDTHIDERGRTDMPIAVIDISSEENLRSLKKMVHYALMAGGPLVWRELQYAYSQVAGTQGLEGDGPVASLVDDLYAPHCTRLGWPLAVLKQFDRQMFAEFRAGGFE